MQSLTATQPKESQGPTCFLLIFWSLTSFLILTLSQSWRKTNSSHILTCCGGILYRHPVVWHTRVSICNMFIWTYLVKILSWRGENIILGKTKKIVALVPGTCLHSWKAENQTFSWLWDFTFPNINPVQHVGAFLVPRWCDFITISPSKYFFAMFSRNICIL